ncbi:tRNA adenosine(34) deaminase TadA [Fodinisporobacter ferrooxydans]
MNHEERMQEALKEAEIARSYGEVPIGAVVYYDGEVVGRGHNMRETWRDPTAHAEILAIRNASRSLGGWRLTGCTLYVTLEPCVMCAGAIVLARFDAIVFGATDPKAGACGSIFSVLDSSLLNHRPKVTSGVLAEECGMILQEFFRNLRRKNC